MLQAAAYVELTPVKVACAWDYRWSSVHAHLYGEDPQKIVESKKLLDICDDWRDYLMQLQSTFEQHLNTGRPLGDDSFIEKIEILLGRDLKKSRDQSQMGIKYCVPRNSMNASADKFTTFAD